MKPSSTKPFVRTENLFPSQDLMWEETRLFIQGSDKKERILAPFEFAQHFPEIEPVQFSYFHKLDDYDVVVFNKAQADRYNDEFIRLTQKNFHYAFGNSVFNVFLKDIPLKSGEDKHEYRREDPKERLKSSVNNFRKSSLKFKPSRFFKQKKLTILVVSASKFGNAGDDAITESSVSILSKAFKGARIILARPPFCRLDVNLADVIVLGGGGILYDSCFNNAMNYCDYLLYAHSQGKKTFGIGLGTQGIKSARGRELYKNSLDTCDVVVVRNERDREVIVNDCGVASPVMTTNDLVFQFGRDITPVKWSEPRKKKKLKIAISLLDSKNLLAAKRMRDYRAGCIDTIEYLCNSFDVCFVVQSKDDLELYNSYIKKYDAKIISYGYGHSKEFIEFYKTVDLSITSRFHGFIFSLLAGIPIISVGSNAGKIERLITSSVPSGRHGYVPLKNFSFESFNDAFANFQTNPKSFIPDACEVRNAVAEAETTVNILKKTIS